jgi:hypothetical protein
MIVDSMTSFFAHLFPLMTVRTPAAESLARVALFIDPAFGFNLKDF